MAGRLAKLTGDEAFERTRARVQELEQRRKELEDELVAFATADDGREEIAELEDEVDRLEVEVDRRRKDGSDMDDMQKLETVEKVAATVGADYRELRKTAEDVYDGVVERIMKRDGCDAYTAHVRAAADPLGQKAYATVVEMQEREVQVRSRAGAIAAYIE